MKTLALILIALAIATPQVNAQLLGASNAEAGRKLGFFKPLDTVNGEVALPTSGGITRSAIFKDSTLVGLTYNYKARGPTNYPRNKDIEGIMRKVIGREAVNATHEVVQDVTWTWKTAGEKYFARYDVKAMILTIGLTAGGS